MRFVLSRNIYNSIPAYEYLAFAGRHIAVISVAFLLVLQAEAFNSKEHHTNYDAEVWTTKNGLPKGALRSIVQTNDGYMWLSIGPGIVRFDGARFTMFDGSNTKQISQLGPSTLWAGRDGNLIFWGSNDVHKFKDGKFTTLSNKEVELHEKPLAIFEDKTGGLWVGTNSSGAVLIKDGKVKIFKDELPGNEVQAIYEDSKGSIWITTNNGVARITDGKIHTYTERNGFPSFEATAIQEDQNKDLWIGTDGGGIVKFSNEKFTVYPPSDELPIHHITTIIKDQEGYIWIGTNGGGLYQFRQGKLTRINQKLFPDNRINCIYEDRESNLWIGLRTGELVKLSRKTFLTYTSAEGLVNDHVNAVYEEKDGSLWIGTRGGLTHYKNNKFINYTVKDGLIHNNVKALYKDRAGTLWIGTAGIGLNYFRNGKIARYDTTELKLKDINSIFESRDGSLWMSLLSTKLIRLKDKKFTVFNSSHGLEEASIRIIYEDRQGNLWVGMKSGLALFKDDKFTTFKGKPVSSVMTIYQDRDNNLWIGTYSGGLLRYKNGTFVSYTSQNGLFDNRIFQIQEDTEGNLWLGSSKGISRVSRKELDDYDHKKIKKISSVVFDSSNGMPSNECTGGGRHLSEIKDSSKIIFPTIKGIVIIKPEEIKINQTPPVVYIEEVFIDKNPVDRKSKIEIPPGKGDLEIHYTGLSFAAPDKVKFKYILEGHDTSWVEAGTRRTAFYTNLPPGLYKFKVMAMNNSGIWNESEAFFEFKLRPHFYQTMYFYVSIAAILLFLIWLGHRLRLKQLKRENTIILAERMRMAREIHDTLAQGFVGISVHLESVDATLFDSPQIAKNHLERAHGLVRSSLAEARRSVWNLRHSALEQGELATALINIAHQFTEGTDVKIEFEVKGPQRRLPPEVENNLLRIGQESITNAIKHAKAQHIRILLQYDTESVQLFINDDGCGFDMKAQALKEDHFGLLGIRERTKELGGQLALHSVPGMGTEIRIILPM